MYPAFYRELEEIEMAKEAGPRLEKARQVGKAVVERVKGILKRRKKDIPVHKRSGGQQVSQSQAQSYKSELYPHLGIRPTRSGFLEPRHPVFEMRGATRSGAAALA